MALACRIGANTAPNAMHDALDFDVNMRLYRLTLEALEIAAVKAKESDVASRVDICRQMYTQAMALH